MRRVLTSLLAPLAPPPSPPALRCLQSASTELTPSEDSPGRWRVTREGPHSPALLPRRPSPPAESLRAQCFQVPCCRMWRLELTTNRSPRPARLRLRPRALTPQTTSHPPPPDRAHPSGSPDPSTPSPSPSPSSSPLLRTPRQRRRRFHQLGRPRQDR